MAYRAIISGLYRWTGCAAIARHLGHHPKMRRRAGLAGGMALSFVVILGLAALLVGLIAADGGLTTGPRINWQALSALAAFGAGSAAAGTLAVLLVSLPDIERNARDSRIDRAPYVRVDLLPTGIDLPSFAFERPYFVDHEQVVTLGGPAPVESRGFSALLRNYQPNALGFAILPTVLFLLEFADPSRSVDDDQPGVDSLEIQVPYLEFGKAVCIELFRFPADWQATVTCQSVGFSDIFGRQVLKSLGEDSSEAMHGRLECSWDGRAFATGVYAQRGRG